MRNEFTAVAERDGPWYIADCPEIPGANGQGKTEAPTLGSLRDTIALILEDRFARHTRDGDPREGRHRVKRGVLLLHLR